MARKKKAPEESGGAGWIVTYGDLMTLLLCFFVLLYGMSTMDQGKYEQLAQALQNALLGANGSTILEQPGTDLEEELLGELSQELENEKGEDIVVLEEFLSSEAAQETLDTLTDYFQAEGLSSDIKVEFVEEGLLLDIKETVLFDLGDASIKPESLKTLNKLSALFEKMPEEIRVVGHTDNIPIQTEKYPSNWELAAARSCAIVRYYTQQGFDPEKMVCLSRGDSQPIASNKTEGGRVQNRRVNFLMVGTPDEIVEIIATLKKD